MKHAYLLFALIMAATTANAELSCQDLAEVGDGLDEVYVALEKVDVIVEDDPLDRALDELIEVMAVIADEEEDRQLDRAVDMMADGWEDMDFDLLEDGIRNARDEIDELYDLDC